MTANRVLLAGIVALAIANGILSPKLMVVFALQGIWYPSWFPAPLQFMFVLSAIILALLYLMLSGVPAAIIENATGKQHSGTTVLLIWLATLMLMSWPTLQPMLFQN